MFYLVNEKKLAIAKNEVFDSLGFLAGPASVTAIGTIIFLKPWDTSSAYKIILVTQFFLGGLLPRIIRAVTGKGDVEELIYFGCSTLTVVLAFQFGLRARERIANFPSRQHSRFLTDTSKTFRDSLRLSQQEPNLRGRSFHLLCWCRDSERRSCSIQQRYNRLGIKSHSSCLGASTVLVWDGHAQKDFRSFRRRPN